MHIARVADLPGVAVSELAALAERCQLQASQHIGYVSAVAPDIEAEVLQVDDWIDWTFVAHDDRGVSGWLLAELDPEMGRVWWWGPFAAPGRWADVADRLLEVGRGVLASDIDEEELCGDSAHVELAHLAATWGFEKAVPSTALTASLSEVPDVGTARAAHVDDAGSLAALHGALFAGSHMTPETAAAVGSDDRIRTVAEADARVVAYAIAEVQADGTGYIDFLGTDPGEQRKGHGRAAISAACSMLVERGCEEAHLTVRETNMGARTLYAALGFREERNLMPYRKGFSLA
ncbi:MAG: GNAT family N-acetyltransferase [Actinomycetia bacterium]|nr:GNAT family N-acetyltransferase [Actinomycetes bacterium]